MSGQIVTMSAQELGQHMQAHHNSESADVNYHWFLHEQDKADHTHNSETGQPEWDGKHVEPPYELKYGEDIVPGDKIMDVECDHDGDEGGPQMAPMGPFAAMMLGGHNGNHKKKYGTLLVMETRTKDQEHISIKTVNDDGKQEAVYVGALQLIKVVV